MGPVDMSASFLIVDAQKYDFPIIYASPNFTTLTGYPQVEVLGKNCRFLQSPDGIVEKGSRRRFVDNNLIYQFKTSIDNFQECQFINVNYKKSGQVIYVGLYCSLLAFY